MPSVGATSGISITWPKRPIAARPMITPRIAVVIGSVIAATVPKVMQRMSIAATIPMTSLAWVDGTESCWPR